MDLCYSIWIISIVGLSVIGYSQETFTTHDEFLEGLKDYSIVVPSRVTRDGSHKSYSLHPGHILRRRSADLGENIQTSDANDNLHYSVDINNKQHVFQLIPNRNLVAPGFVIERKKYRFKNVTDSTFSKLSENKAGCHYHGQVVNQTNSRVAVGLCNGLHGFIHTELGEYFIEPLKSDVPGSDGRHRHVIYKRSALPDQLDPARASAHAHKRSADDDDSCGVHEFDKAQAQRERWEAHRRQRRDTSSTSAHRRTKRSFSTERYVETLVVVDPSMIKYHKNEHLETYVLTIMNMVATMFYDASIGNSINIVLVRILLMEDEQEELVITHHADKTLQSFCKFQKKINFKEDDHPNHHDVAILLTRKNICSRLDEPCGTLGLAEVSGMCQPHRSCSINEDTGLALAYTVTHELGHNFGMHHDGHRNGCVDPPGHQLYIMSPSLIADSLTKSWSNCSKHAITTFIDRDWGYCLDDEPTAHKYNFPVLPPGTMYDADHQCRLQYGTDNASICGDQQDVCSNLWCRTDNKCSTHLEAAAEGTICAKNKWCYQGKCVKIGERLESINGEWGEWTPWTDCSRSCGAGVSHSMRHCENPAPSHGGKYCLGERKRYRICNTEDCEDDSVSFQTTQCKEFNFVPYKKRLYEWEHVPSPESPCQLHCKPKGHFFSVLLKDIVTDGTPCTAGTLNMCISGRCRHIGCDYTIDSPAKEDRCGVCHGDGSTCTTVKSQYNESQGLGYVEAAVIPAGARNIRVEEVAEANNFLALQNSEGEYYLNGHWFIQWSGDYPAAGTVIQYQRRGNKESVVAAGPLKEPLHVMLLLQSSNPGVEFEYTVPKNNITELREPEFHWVYQPWTHCTASCGGGSQRSEVVCTELEAGIVEDKYCKEKLTAKPDDKQRVCNEHLCPARWWTGTWQHCSVTCGSNGIHHRTVICVRSLGPEEQIALDDESCTAEEKPAETEPCHKKEICPGNSTWITGEWSDCTKNMCGLKYRRVTCKDPVIGCHDQAIPISEMPCTEVQCGEWAADDWTQCSESCQGGFQDRNVWCAGSDHCDMRYKPHNRQMCNSYPCPTIATQTEPVSTQSLKISTLPSTEETEKSDDTDGQDDIASQEGTENEVKQVKNIPNSTERNTIDSQTENTPSDKDIDDSAQSSDSVQSSDNEHTDANTKDSSEIDGVDGEVDHVDTSTDDSTGEQIDSDSLEVVDFDSEEKIENDKKNQEHSMTKDIEESNECDQCNDEMNENSEESTEAIPADGTKHENEEDSENDKSDIAITETESTHSDNNDIKDPDIDGVPDTTVVTTGTDAEPDDEYDIVEESFDDSSEKNVNDKNSNVNNTREAGENTKPSEDIKPVVNSPLSNTPISKFSDPIVKNPNFKDMPPLPEDGKLPSLPKLDNLGPLPDFKDLPSFMKGELPNVDKLNMMKFGNREKLPDLSELPPLPENSRVVPKLPTMPNKDKILNPTEIPNKKILNKESNPEDRKGDTSHGDSSQIPQEKLLTTKPDEIHKPPSAAIETSDQNLPHSEDINKLNHKNHDLTRPVNVGDSDIKQVDNSDINTGDLTGDLDTSKAGDSVSFGEGDLLSTVGREPAESEVVKEKETFTWIPETWTECSRNCEGGVRTRVVTCVNELSSKEVDQLLCDINTKPTAIEDCNKQQCKQWLTSQWGQCSAACGHSIRQRQVTCREEGSCDQDIKPINEERCNMPTCARWVSGPWNRCNKKCGGGEQLRLVQCVNVTSQRSSHGCDYSQKPHERRNCNSEPCKDRNAALSIRCQSNEMSAVICRALRKMGRCNNRFIALKCCKTCSAKAHKQSNKYRPRGHALRR